MARAPRTDIGGEIYHCLNRSVGRQQIFHDAHDYKLFEDILEEVNDITSVDGKWGQTPFIMEKCVIIY